MTPERWYRVLLRVYPAWFRDLYGEEMVRSFLRLLEMEGERKGLRGRAWVWLGAGLDALKEGTQTRVGAGAPRLRTSPKDLDTRIAGRRTGTHEQGMMTTMKALLEGLAQDLRFGLRALVRRPVFATTVVTALALGVGASTAIFSVVNGLVLKPLPYDEPGRLVALWSALPERGWSRTDVNMADAWEWGERSEALAQVSVHDDRRVALTGGDRPEFVDAIYGTSNVLGITGVEPVMGRDFVPEDNREGAEGVAILQHDFWQARFGGDPEILGRTLMLNGEPYTVIGILPRGFSYTDEIADLFIPWRRDPTHADRRSHSYEAVGRLAPGATVEGVRNELARITRDQAEAHPEANPGWRAQVVPLRKDMAGEPVIRASTVLMVAGAFVLLMACVNVSNLLLARANGRRREMAIRAAMGAERGRVMRQLLVETGILATLGGAAGILLAVQGWKAIAARLPDFILSPALGFGMDWRVLTFTVGVTALALIGVGLLPALRSSRTDPVSLRDGQRSGGGRRGKRFGTGLVVVQTALAMVLLVAGGVLFQSVSTMKATDLGFEPEGVLTVGLIPPESRYPDDEARNRLFGQITERVRAIPGVQAAGWIHSPPLLGNNWSEGIRIPGLEIAGEEEGLHSRLDYVTPGYLEAMEIELRRGRALRVADRADAEPVVLVNEAFVQRYMPGEDPLTHSIEGIGSEIRRIVGVVENTVERDLNEPAEPTTFVPQAQRATHRRFLVARVRGGDPMAVSDQVQRQVWSVDPDLPMLDMRPMSDLVALRLSGFRLIADLMGAFALLALVLGAVGIYGVTAYGVTQRRTEIGIRVALGAGRGQVRRRVVRDGMTRTALGLGLGALAAFFLVRALEVFLVGVSASDPATFAAVAGVLSAVSFLAAYLPARRASAVDPVEVLAGE